MNSFAGIFKEGISIELQQFRRSPIIIFLICLQAVTFIFLVSLFALTGSMAPTAIVSEDNGAYAKAFIQDLAHTHHSFRLLSLSMKEAKEGILSGKIVAIITIPQNFSSQISENKPVKLRVQVDNVNTDFTDDIQRAIPATIVAFGKQYGFYGITVQSEEYAVFSHDTGYIAYLVVSGLAIDTFVVAVVLGGMLAAREYEKKTILLLQYSPFSPFTALSGKIFITWAIAFMSMLLPSALVVWGFGVYPLHPVLLIILLGSGTFLFLFVGILLGCMIKKVLPVANLAFGLAIPLYIVSGALEPERFDGSFLWVIAHFSPVYSFVALFEYVFHGFQITPEPIRIDVFVLFLWGIVVIVASKILLGSAVNKI
jgi:ABC-2 type transport system permease protein